MTQTDGSGGTGRLKPVVAHETRVFLLGDDGSVQPIAHCRYVAVVRGEAVAREFAGRRFLLVDWYLHLIDGRPEAVVNETCSWVVFDAQGWLDLRAAHAIDAEAVPRKAQWAQVRALVFDDALQPRLA